MLGMLPFGNWLSRRRGESQYRAVDMETSYCTCLVEQTVMWLKDVTALSLNDSNTWEEWWSSGPGHGLICPNTPVTFCFST